ncbi:MAG: hypothetical protein Q4D24_07735 [Erysipelotrichaceae bacterium]|nr:hypothetical protein [Erysipelotrichaceae bacterium]
MERYGIIDIGSNTIVLIIYTIHGNIPVPTCYQSVPVHLIDYIEEGHMREEGICKTVQVLQRYREQLQLAECANYEAFITEPWRGIDNHQVMLEQFRKIIPVNALSGEEEASYDYYGSRLSWPDISNGIAFDIGGGSTELISFKNQKITAAMSFPLGCVRLSHLPLETEECANEIMKARNNYPSLDVKAESVIAIGGTVRAFKLLCDDLYHTGSIIPSETVRDLYHRLLSGEKTAADAMYRIIDPARIPVFLPGIHMMLEIIRIYGTQKLYVSETGIREGFLVKKVLGQ